MNLAESMKIRRILDDKKIVEGFRFQNSCVQKLSNVKVVKHAFEMSEHLSRRDDERTRSTYTKFKRIVKINKFKPQNLFLLNYQFVMQ